MLLCANKEDVEKLQEQFKEQIGEIEVHNVRLSALEMQIKTLNESLYGCRKYPYKCPVCDGCGNDKGITQPNLNFDFYMKYASCHACEGKCIVWG